MLEVETGIKPAESFRDRIATVDAAGKRKWVYAQKPQGRFYNARTRISWCFFLLFFLLPFVQVKGRPLLLFNITEARFIIFGKVFWPQDFFIFGLTMITFIVFVILFTAAFGRLFCGWVCPQTIFLEMFFRKIEYAIEGNAQEQKLLNKAPWNGRKLLKKVTKHVVFYLASFIIANTFLSYIIGVKALRTIITGPVNEHLAGLGSILVFSGVFYAVYAFFREQACTVACPYGRLQAVLMDRNSMIVAYDHKRGEPRGKKHTKTAGVPGDCIDCLQCVKVCPTAIDIRNGVQMECVGCTACIDACDHVMAKLDQPLGLIRYASENGIEKNEPLKYTGRMKMYTVLQLLLLVLLGLLLHSRKEVDATIMRTPGVLYQERDHDSISNLFNIKVANKTAAYIPLQLKMHKSKGRIEMVGGKNYLPVAEDVAGSGSFFIVLPADEAVKRKNEVEIGLYNGNDRIDVIKTNFLGPGK